MQRFCALVCSLALALAVGGPALAVPPAAELLPDTTKAILSIPDVDLLRAHFNSSDLGQLLQDPAMQPFAEDLHRQIEQKLSQTGVRLGLQISDLEGVYGGEVAVAAIQPENDPEQAAVVLLVDITGKEAEAQELLAKVDRNMQARNATKETRQAGGATLTIYTVPARDNKPEMQAVLTTYEDRLLASDNVAVAEGVIGRFEGSHSDTLAGVAAYQAVKARIATEADGLAPDLSWFAEPFGYAQVVRAQAGGRSRRGTDMLKVLMSQGFTAIQGVGGNVNFSTEGHELLHRTYVYAPPVVREPGSTNTDRYDLAMRMLSFPNTNELQPEPWVTRELASYTTFLGELQQAFDYCDTLVDAVAGDEGFFRDVLDSLEHDPNGPMIDVRNDFVRFLGQRVTVMTDYVLPITSESERLMVAIEVTNPQAVAETVARAMESDNRAHERQYNGYTIWEIVEEEAEMIPLQIDGFGPPPGGVAPAPEPQEEERLVKNAAVTVANGHLIIATHIDFLTKMLDEVPRAELLSMAADYQHIDIQLTELGASEFCAKFFTRTDEAYRPTYELIQQGKMPEAKTVLAQTLNYLLGPEDETQLREQQIDGSKLPDYQIVRRYLGPAGMYAQSEDEGWLIVGITDSKHPETHGERIPVEMADVELGDE